MSRTPEQPPRDLTEGEMEDYHRDGVICVRGLYSREWIERLTSTLDAIYAQPSFTAPGVSDTFRADAFTWLTNDDVRDFVLHAPSARIAQQAMGSKAVNFFYDQIFIKAALTPDPTPWHHDATFWPIAGNQICSLWTSVDAVDPDSSALEFVAGSHLWGKDWKPVGLGGFVASKEDLEMLPDIDEHRDAYRILSWSLEPGDALLFHARTVHGSRGNKSATTGRRAITTRWAGDDAIYRPVENGRMPLMWNHGLTTGDRLGGILFPRVLPDIDDEALAARMSGPIYPEAALMAKAMTFFEGAERVPVKM